MARRKARKATSLKTTETISSEVIVESPVLVIPNNKKELNALSNNSFNATLNAPMQQSNLTSTTVTEVPPERVRKVVSPVDIAISITKGVNKQHEIFQVRANTVLIKEIFEQIREQIAEMEDGVVVIKGLGTFNCRTVLRE